MSLRLAGVAGALLIGLLGALPPTPAAEPLTLPAFDDADSEEILRLGAQAALALFPAVPAISPPHLWTPLVSTADPSLPEPALLEILSSRAPPSA